MNKKSASNQLVICPNPASDKITVEMPQRCLIKGHETLFLVYSMTGQEMMRQVTRSSRVEIDIKSLPYGIYLVKVVTPGSTSAGKFVKAGEAN